MTMAEQILAHHSGRDKVSPGDFVEASIDMAMVHEALGVSGQARLSKVSKIIRRLIRNV